MVERHIHIAPRHTEKLKCLVGGSNAMYETYVDALAHAAAKALAEGRSEPVQKVATKPGPIKLDVFQGRGHGFLIELTGVLNNMPGVQAFEEAENSSF